MLFSSLTDLSKYFRADQGPISKLADVKQTINLGITVSKQN